MEKKKNGILTKREKERERENYRVYTTINNRSKKNDFTNGKSK